MLTFVLSYANILFVLYLARIYLLRLVDLVMGMKSWAKQFLLGLAVPSPHRFDGIKVCWPQYLPFHPLHRNY